MYNTLRKFLTRVYIILEKIVSFSLRIFKSCRILGENNAFKLLLLDKFGNSRYYQLQCDGLSKPTFLRPRTTDGGTFSSIFVDRSYPFFPNFEARTIIDAGANCGYASLFYSIAYPNANIVALEPESSNFELLNKNTYFLPNIDCWKGALWNSKGKINILNNSSSKDSFQVNENFKISSNEINSFRIEDIMQTKSWESIDILKMDIEGAEKEVFESENKCWLKFVKILIVELHEDYKPGCGDAFATAVAGHGFQFYRRGENYILVRPELGLKVSP